MYGDVKRDRGFWYSHPLYELRDLNEEQLFWVPDDNALCLLWHAAHIAHRERLQIARIIQGIEGEIIPLAYEVFGAEWRSVNDVRAAVDSVDSVLAWIRDVRAASTAFIAALDEADVHKPAANDALSTGHWLFITVGHGALHIGKMQVLRNMLLGQRDNPC
jgi:hypothetical protein